MAKVTVILITHNNEAHVAKAVEALRAQTVADWQCLIVDNGSTDATAAIAEEEVARDGRFRVYRKANEGPSGGRNYGFNLVAADCDYVAFLDGDDWVEPAFLEVMSGYLERHPEVGLVTCGYARVDASGKRLGVGSNHRNVPNAVGFPRRMRADELNTPFVAFFVVSGQGPFALYRCSVFRQTTGYEPTFSSHEDTDMFCQMALLAEVHALPDELYAKREHAANLTRAGNTNPFAQSCYEAFRKKWNEAVFADPRKERLLRDARRYYYTRHLPCRNLLVLGRCLMELPRHHEARHLRWMGMLLRDAVRGLFFDHRKFG